ncbi:MAG: hypothetical protein J5496_09425 [Lachnospiraceae bacterium]|nr:hypothetical protein [Lachnospiraceae bacterium]
MKKEKISRILSEIDGKYVEEAAMADDAALPQGARSVSLHRGGKPSRRFRFGLAAACLAAVLLLGTGAFALRAEAKEYQAAVQFFEENGLSTEGLSRTEVKAVYRDITTKSFTYGKTAEVIRQAVPGWEIAQEEVTPQELSKWWEQKYLTVTDDPGETDPAVKPFLEPGIQFLSDFQGGVDAQGNVIPEKGILSCYRDKRLVWTAEFPNRSVTGWSYFEEGTLVWGKDRSDFAAWMACVDEAGNFRWQRNIDHAFQFESISFALSDDDGSWAVISRGDYKYLCLTRLDRDGKELYFHQTEVGELAIWGAVRLGDGYLVHLGRSREGDYAHLYRMDHDGNITENYAFTADEYEYHIAGMTEFEGQVYLSAYTVPALKTPGFGREEIQKILDILWPMDDHGADITSEELTPLVRENYTAVLLICDPEGGTPQTFWSVKGSVGDSLSVNDAGALEWRVKRIDSSYYSPYTSAYTIGCVCSVFRYTFDESGSLIGRADTGETAQFHR